MQPIFIAHLVGDFLLQPTWLVNLKQRRLIGVILHAAIHTALMFLLVLPDTDAARATILAIGLSHGIIDAIKIRVQKKSKGFALGFFIDQCAHFGVLAAAIFLTPLPAIAFWQTESGVGILALLIFFSIAFGVRNLLNLPAMPLTSKFSGMKRIALVTSVFILFVLPAIALAASCGSAP